VSNFWRGAGVILTVILIYKFIMKEDLIYVFEQNLGVDEAGVLRGILLGDKTGFRKELYEDLKKSGLVHLMVASGANVVLMSRFLIEQGAKFWGRKWAIGWGLSLIWGYAAWVGWEAPILRAGILVSIMYWGQILGRKYNLWRGVLLAGLIMFLIDFNFYKSVSFWLSMLSFGAIVIMDELKLKFFKGNVGQTVGVSLAVTPVLALVFGQISLVAPLSNFLVVFLVEVVSVLGVVGLILSSVGVEELVFWGLNPLLGYIVAVSEWSTRWKWAAVEVGFNWWMLLGWYMVLIFFVKKMYERRQ